MEQTQTQNTETSSFFKNEDRNAYLREVAKWSRFLSITGFIAMGILIIISVVMIAGMNSFASRSNIGFSGVWIGLLYIGFAVLYYFPLKYLFAFSKEIKLALNLENEDNLTEGLKNLKSVFKFMGITTIVILIIYAIIFIVAILATGILRG